MTTNLRYPGLILMALAISGCAMTGSHRHDASARADMVATKGNTTSGTVVFHQMRDTIGVHATITGLKPGQEHGFHIHEKGDCSSGDGMSTGGHFNPTGAKHGAQHEERHAGDLPALKADANGAVKVHFHLKGLAIGAGASDIIGKGLIIHAMPDDYKTQPTGNSGARIACGVIVKG